ncbi:MAG: hypothetical protein Kow0031_11420 [Anaerolineae bacterium]
MHTEDHIDKYIETYLDNTLPPEQQQRVEAHLAACAECAQKAADARYLHQQLAIVFNEALGEPLLRPDVRRQLKNRLAAAPARRTLPWGVPLRLVNAVGTVTVVALLAVGAYAVIQGQIPGLRPNLAAPMQFTAAPAGGGADFTPTPPAPTPTAVAQAAPVSTEPPARAGGSVGDTVNTPRPANAATANQARPTSAAVAPANQVELSRPPSGRPVTPGGTIAFPLYSGSMYHIYFVDPDGGNLTEFPMPGVSEPALHPAENDYALSARSWNDPDGPRTLVTANHDAVMPQAITHFWEDAQPDWSPTENRVIFASQRESDRKWRLYTAWGDGSLEVNLRREGRSPTFAPDGYRFAFESCHATGNLCGLWLANLDTSETAAEPFLTDPQAKSPDWSPVSEEIVYMANPGENWDIYLTDSSGATPRRLTDDPARDGLPVWSPDGQWLAFVSDRGGAWGLWLLHPASGELRPVRSLAGGELTPPQQLPYTQHGERFWWDEQISWGK